MIQLTKLQATLLKTIEENPGTTYSGILIKSGISNGNGTRTLRSLVEKGMVTREGTTRKYKHYSTGQAYEVVDKLKVEYVVVPKDQPDTLIMHAASATLTDEQKLYAVNHKHVPRSKLAQMFGMTKLELNFALTINN